MPHFVPAIVLKASIAEAIVIEAVIVEARVVLAPLKLSCLSIVTACQPTSSDGSLRGDPGGLISYQVGLCTTGSSVKVVVSS